MCNFFFNTFFSIHYNRCTNSDRKRPALLLRRRSSPALPIINRQELESEKLNLSLASVSTDDIITVNEKVEEDISDSEDDDVEGENESEAKCVDKNIQENNTHNNKHMSQDSSNETDESDEAEDYDQFDTTDNVCGCGKTLSKGWVCNDCRVQCSKCKRALSTDPDDYCSRCYFKCQEHGLIMKKIELFRFQFEVDACHLCKNKSNPDSLSAPSLQSDKTNNNDDSS